MNLMSELDVIEQEEQAAYAFATFAMAEESARNNTARNTTAEEIMKHAEASAQSGSNMNSTRRSKKRKFNNKEMIVLGNPLGSRREDSPTQGTSTRFNTGFNFN